MGSFLVHPTRAQYDGDMCNSTIRKSIDQMLRSMFFQRSLVFYTKRLYRLDVRREAKPRMADNDRDL